MSSGSISTHYLKSLEKGLGYLGRSFERNPIWVRCAKSRSIWEAQWKRMFPMEGNKGVTQRSSKCLAFWGVTKYAQSKIGSGKLQANKNDQFSGIQSFGVKPLLELVRIIKRRIQVSVGLVWPFVHSFIHSSTHLIFSDSLFYARQYSRLWGYTNQ